MVFPGQSMNIVGWMPGMAGDLYRFYVLYETNRSCFASIWSLILPFLKAFLPLQTPLRFQ
jgi:hypothetical protein